MNCLLLLCLALICGLIDASTYTIQVGWQAALDANDVPQWYSLWFYPTTLTIVYGDIVHWHFATREIHNVVFTNGTRQTETEPNGVNVTAIAGVVGPNIFTDYELTYSSGFRAIGTDDYSLTFNPTVGQGSFAFYCSIHGGMDGVITVLPRGSTAPLTPSEVADQQAIIINGMIEDAVNQTAHIDANKPTSGPQVTHTVQPDGTVNWVIGSGQMSHSGGGMQMYARFLPEYVEIQINDTITWSIDGDDPHWVFFSRNAFPPLFHGYDPLAGQPMNASTTYVNAPYKLGITWFNGPAPSPVIPLQTWPNSQGYINSGLMFGPNGPPVFPKSITVRFTESGTFSYVCPIHADLDMYGEVVVKPRGSLLCSTPGNLATCGRVGSQVRGDPQFVGLLGQSFQVHGIDGGIYNLITDDDIQVNSKFTFISESEVTSCPSFPWKFAGLSQAISCWSHDGSYLSQIGVMDNQGNRLSLIAGSPVQGFSSIELNNQQVNPSNNEPINQGKLRVTVFSSHHIEVVVDEYTLLIENSDNFLNLASVYVAGSRWSSMSSHGLLGQTWHRPIKSAQKSIKHIEGDVDDYLVNGGDLFGTDFMYNRFTKA